jgi:hypothetical protein
MPNRRHGPEVNPVLRAAALPGANLFIAATAGPGRAAGAALARGLTSVGLQPSPEVAEVARGYASLADAGRRNACSSDSSRRPSPHSGARSSGDRG